MFEGFWFSNAFKRISLNLFYEHVYPFKYFLIGFLPIQIVFPRGLRKYELHSMSSLFLPLPLSSSATALIKRRVFFGLLKR